MGREETKLKGEYKRKNNRSKSKNETEEGRNFIKGNNNPRKQ